MIRRGIRALGEAGAGALSPRPVWGYWADRREGKRCGVVFLAGIPGSGPLPESEMAEARVFPGLSANLAYPETTPALFARLAKEG